jgi:hypothetical protein
VEERIRHAASAAAETQRALDAASQQILELQVSTIICLWPEVVRSIRSK